MPRAREAALREFARRILLANGLTPDEAATIANGLIQANMRGVDSHGALRLIQYTDALSAGRINVRPEVTVVRRRGATALLTADPAVASPASHRLLPQHTRSGRTSDIVRPLP